MPSSRPRIEFAVSYRTLKTLGLAALCGVRSLGPPALLARSVQRGRVGGLDSPPFNRLGPAANALLILMAGEMLADKTSLVPARTSAGPAIGRALSGAFVGAAMFAADGRRGAPGAVSGGVSALAGLYAANRARKQAAKHLPDPLWGVLEDILVLLAGSTLTRKDAEQS